MFNRRPPQLTAPSATVSTSKHSRTIAKPEEPIDSYPFWNPNTHLVTTLTVDMDFPDSETRLSVCCAAHTIPEPDYYIVNEDKGTLQASWMIMPFPSYLLHNDSSVGWLYSRILESLRIHLHGDPCFTDSRRRNPYFCKGSQRVMTSESAGMHTLAHMREWLASHDSFNDGVHDLQSRRLVASAYRMAGAESSTDTVDIKHSYHHGERNAAVFRAAVKAARNGVDAEKAARSVHCIPALPASEISSCVKSAIRSASRDFSSSSSSRGSSSNVSSAVSRQCSSWGTDGGNANTPRQVRSRLKNLQRGRTMTSIRHVMVRDRVMVYLRTYGNAGLRFLSSGGSFSGHTITLLASRVGCSRQTVYRCLKEIYGMIMESGIGEFLSRFHIMSLMRGRVAGMAVLLASCMNLDVFKHYLDIHDASLSNWNDIGLTGNVVVHGMRLSLWEGVGIK